MNFDDLNLIPQLLEAIRDEGYEQPTPIQERGIPRVMEGRDVLGCAQTGTGKTAAFALPILQRLYQTGQGKGRRAVRALVVAPTRELASQIHDSFAAYGQRTGIRQAVIFGGVGQGPQVQALTRGVDVLVATPGRLMDLMDQGHVVLGKVQVLVLDEADRMLDMGFINDIRRIVRALPRERQTLLFSATLPPDIAKLGRDILVDPVRVSVTPPTTTVDAIEQSLYFVEKADKISLLIDLLMTGRLTRCLVFSRTKHGADKIVRKLARASIAARAIHGNKSQNQRTSALLAFKDGSTRVLIATDIAARGLDIDEVSHVINLDLPYEPEVYIHRIGRTGRAGAAGSAISFCSTDERPLLRDIERLIRMKIPQGERPPASNVLVSGPPRPQPQREPGQQPASQPNRRRRRRRRGPPGAPVSTNEQSATRGAAGGVAAQEGAAGSSRAGGEGDKTGSQKRRRRRPQRRPHGGQRAGGERD